MLEPSLCLLKCDWTNLTPLTFSEKAKELPCILAMIYYRRIQKVTCFSCDSCNTNFFHRLIYWCKGNLVHFKFFLTKNCNCSNVSFTDHVFYSFVHGYKWIKLIICCRLLQLKKESHRLFCFSDCCSLLKHLKNNW